MNAKEWARWLKVVYLVLLLVTLWVALDHYRTATIILSIAQFAVMVSAVTLENKYQEQLFNERWRQTVGEHDKVSNRGISLWH